MRKKGRTEGRRDRRREGARARGESGRRTFQTGHEGLFKKSFARATPASARYREKPPIPPPPPSRNPDKETIAETSITLALPLSVDQYLNNVSTSPEIISHERTESRAERCRRNSFLVPRAESRIGPDLVTATSYFLFTRIFSRLSPACQTTARRGDGVSIGNSIVHFPARSRRQYHDLPTRWSPKGAGGRSCPKYSARWV